MPVMELNLNDVPVIAAAVKNLFQRMLADQQLPADVLHCLSRALLVVANSEALEPAATWQLAHPQGEQGGLAYLRTVAAYSEAERLSALIRARGGKITQLLGRQYMRLALPQLQSRLAHMHQQHDPLLAGVAESDFRSFIAVFQRELHDDASVVWHPARGAVLAVCR